MLRPGSLISRLLAATLLFLVVWFFVQLAVLPVVGAYRTTAREIGQNQALLERYRALAEERPRYARRLERRLEASEANTGFLAGQNETLAAAALQERVGEVIGDAGGELRSTQILQTRVADEELAIRRAGLLLQFSTTIVGLEEILYQLETDEPYLFIDEINIREQRTRRRRNEAEQETRLDVSLEIYGFVRSASEDEISATTPPKTPATLVRRG